MSLKISELYVYPIKSLGGIPLQSARVMEKGIQHDRRWMLMDESNVFLTQRIHNHMALFKTSLSADGVGVAFKDDFIEIPFDLVEGGPVRAKIWDDEVTVNEVSDKHSAWFTKHIGMNCKLVAFPENNQRLIDPKYRIADENVSLADAYPLLIIGQSSLDDLNERMSSPVPMNRFRPNVVFTGGDPFDEDTWKRFAMGLLNFAGVKPCKRCILPTVDQETGVKGVEPLATLSKFRRKDNSTGVYFGQNVTPLSLGEISVGDEIIIIE
jgi:uncharacterized protein